MSHRPLSFFQRVTGLAILVFCGILLAHGLARQLLSIGASAPPRPSAPSQSIGSAPAPFVYQPQGDLAPLTPSQSSIDNPRLIDFKGYQMRELAHFQATGVLLSRAAYSAATSQGNAEHRRVLSPYDIALGWGPMSNPAVLRNFSYFQKNRFFYYAAFMDFLPFTEALHTDWHVANIHLIPASDEIADAMSRLQPRDIVTVEGSLVEVSFRGQVLWRSSLSRTDSGDGACELLLINRLSWISQPPSTQSIPLPQDPPPNA